MADHVPLRHRVAAGIDRVNDHVAVKIAVAVGLFLSSLDDLLEEFGVEELFGLDVHHGLLLYGGTHFLKVVRDLLKKTQDLEKEVVERVAELRHQSKDGDPQPG